MKIYNRKTIEPIEPLPDLPTSQIKFEEDPQVRFLPKTKVGLSLTLIGDASPAIFELIIQLYNSDNEEYIELKMEHCLPTYLFPDNVSITIAAMCGDEAYSSHKNIARVLANHLVESAVLRVDSITDQDEIIVEFALSVKEFTTVSAEINFNELNKFLEII